MSRNTGSKCRLCRREGMKLFLKGHRCFAAKCAVERRDSTPGMRTWRRGKPSGYHNQLREKQKVKRYYGVREAQFRRFFAEAERAAGNTGEALLVMLEKRLDNVITIKDTEKAQKLVKDNVELAQDRDRPQWLQVDPTKPSITVMAAPVRDDVSVEAHEQLVIEFLSK